MEGTVKEVDEVLFLEVREEVGKGTMKE